ncbi:MAG: cupin domain-containing protein [Burkholderiales bacterium]
MTKPVSPALDPAQVPEQSTSGYPEIYRARVAGRHRRRLGDGAGLKNFGVNLVTLDPRSESSMRHWHAKQDEFIYVLEGELTLITNAGRQTLRAGMAAGFPAGRADGHQLVNETDRPATYLEVGDRTPDDNVAYPDVDLAAGMVGAKWVFTHKDGRPYE